MKTEILRFTVQEIAIILQKPTVLPFALIAAGYSEWWLVVAHIAQKMDPHMHSLCGCARAVKLIEFQIVLNQISLKLYSLLRPHIGRPSSSSARELRRRRRRNLHNNHRTR